jgi:NitT/TauT family transport system substrate-binding protein
VRSFRFVFGRRRSRVVGLGAVVIAAAGVGAYGVAPVGAKTKPKAPHCSSYANLSVGYTPSLSGLPLLVGANLGIFKQECLNVTPTLVPTPPNSYPELLAGQLQALQGSSLVTATFAGNGAPVNIVGGLEVESTNAKNNWWQVLTLKSNKTITSLKSLVGQTIGVAQLNSFTTLGIQEYLAKAGLSPAAIKFVVIPQQNQLSALQAGEVQAIYQGQPYVTQSEQIAPMKIVWSGAPAQNTPIGSYEMTSSYEAANPTVVKEFQKAIPLAYAAVTTHRLLAEALAKSALSLTEATVKKMAFPVYVKKFPVAALDQDEQLELQFGYIKAIPPNSTLLDFATG